MGVVGSLLIPLLIGVEASVGATDKKAEHSVVGLIMVLVYFFMAAAGRIRYLKLAGHMVGKKSDLYSKILHIYGGYVILVLAWWNCYTGLVRIGPEDSYAQIIVLSSYPMGYNVPIFGHIRKYVFSPYISFVILVFLIAEIRLRRKNTKHGERLERYLDGTASILTWDDDKDKVLETMTIETFLDVTRLGSALCIVDGRVLDITDFMDVHPGGRDILRFASGADVTEELLGLRDVGGIKHAHTNGALNLLKKLVKAKLVNANSGKNSPSSEHFVSIPKRLGSIGPPGDVSTKSADTSQGSGRVPPHTTRPKQGSPGLNSQAFRPGRVLAMKYLTPAMDLTKASKPVIMLRLSLPRHSGSSYHNQKDDAPFLPSFAFTFRAVDKRGSTVERQYTPVNLDKNLLQDSIKGIKQSNNQSEDEVYAFLISLIPGGQMSTFLMGLKVGKTVLVQGPKINPKTLAKVDSLHWKSVVMLAAGTGISPILQLIDHYLASQSDGRPSPQLFLVWILKSPQHAYPEAVDLNERVKFSSGRFKWVIIYSSSGSKKQSLQRGRGSMDVVDRSGEDDEKDMFWDLRDAGGKDTFTRSWWGGTVIGKQPLKARESLKDMIVMERDKCSPTLAEEFAMHSDDESVEFDAGFWSSSHRCLTRKCDIFLLGDVLSSIDEYVKVGDCDTEKEVDSSQVLLEEAHSTTPRKNYGANIYQIFGNKLGANISSTTRLGSVEGEDEIAFERKVKNPRSSKIQKVKKQILDAISLSRHIDPGEVSTNGAISEGSHDGCAPGNDQGAGNGLSDKISEHEAQAPDVEEGLAQRKFQNVLVAVSGSPMFEVEILPNLKKLGLPSEQVVIFHTSTVQI
jgi:cytochrome b involved in lipid metabolism